MSADFLSDLDIVDPATLEYSEPNLPAGQWLNGDPKMASVGGVSHTGGLLIPLRHLPSDFQPPAGWSFTKIAFSSGKVEEVVATGSARLAVVRSRFRWGLTVRGQTTYHPRGGWTAGSGMRGHLQILAGIPGLPSAITLTFKGKASQEFEGLVKAFDQKVVKEFNDYARSQGKSGTFPRFAFYMTLKPGPHTKVGPKGQESIITPPALVLPKEVDPAYLQKIYVGREFLLNMTDWFHDTEKWVHAWDGTDMPEQNAAPVEDDPGFEEPLVETIQAVRKAAPAPVLSPEQSLEEALRRREAETVLDAHTTAPGGLQPNALGQTVPGAQSEGKASLDAFFEAPTDEAALVGLKGGVASQAAGPVVPHPGPAIPQPDPNARRPKSLNIKDGKGWNELLRQGKALGYTNPFHLQGVLLNAGWTNFLAGDLDKALVALKAHAAESKTIQAQKERESKA